MHLIFCLIMVTIGGCWAFVGCIAVVETLCGSASIKDKLIVIICGPLFSLVAGGLIVYLAIAGM